MFAVICIIINGWPLDLYEKDESGMAKFVKRNYNIILVCTPERFSDKLPKAFFRGR